MRRPAMILLLVAALPVTAFAQAPAANPRQEVLGLVRAYADALNRSGITSYVDMYAQRPDLIVVNDGDISRGWDALRNGANEMMGTEGTFRISVGAVDVMTVRTDLVIAVFPFVMTVSTPEGPTQVRGAMTLVFERSSQGWRIIHDHTSTAAPQTGP